MSTATLPETETATTIARRRAHWVCLLQDAMPYVALCGELPSEQRRVRAARLDCKGCLEHVHAHVATCAYCKAYRGVI